MTDGLKPGSGSDPFNEDAEGDDNDVEATEERKSADEESNPPDHDEPAGIERESTLPWIYRRDGVKSARDHTYQLHLQSATRDREKHFQTEIEERLGEDVYKADLREAALLVAMDRPDAVLNQLREWGYDA